ncbi:hypothetical protein C0992_005111 [Termitomyces sp. T32_za158]|nr:hypothetical protein C0992_005111 [Termitomyces sp. T32_za158]
MGPHNRQRDLRRDRKAKTSQGTGSQRDTQHSPDEDEIYDCALHWAHLQSDVRARSVSRAVEDVQDGGVEEARQRRLRQPELLQTNCSPRHSSEGAIVMRKDQIGAQGGKGKYPAATSVWRTNGEINDALIARSDIVHQERVEKGQCSRWLWIEQSCMVHAVAESDRIIGLD